MLTIEELKEMTGVSDEIAQKVLDSFKDADGNKVPKSRLDEVIAERNTYKDRINNLESEMSNLKELSGDTEALNNKIAELEKTNQKAKADFDKAIRQTKIENAINLALIEAEAINPATVKPLIKMNDILLTEDGTMVVGLKEQIEKLKDGEDTSFLFGKKQKSIKGVKPTDGTGAPKPPKSDSEKSYWDWAAELENN